MLLSATGYTDGETIIHIKVGQETCATGNGIMMTVSRGKQ